MGFLLVNLFSCNTAIIGATGPYIEKGKDFVNFLSDNKFDDAISMFDQTMKEAMSSNQLKEIWKTLQNQVGNYKQIVGERMELLKPYYVVFITCKFERSDVDIKIVFDESVNISGLFFLPSINQNKYTIPEYADTKTIVEEQVSIGKDPFILPATLTMPYKAELVPAVILVHGSGPHDRDQTVGPNKPFKDISFGLAAKGIAVLRYEKRTEYIGKMGNKIKLEKKFTIKEEVIDDALYAVEFLKGEKNIDKNKIFILGHSLGGMVLPRMSFGRTDIRGLIYLAAPSRPFEQILLEQMEYLAMLDEKISPEEGKNIEKLKKQIDNLAKLSTESDSNQLPFNISAAYWIDLKKYNNVEIAKKLNVSMLFLQGERDYQVTIKDFEIWKDALKDNEKVKFISYSLLNHLFMEGKGKCNPDEYFVAGHVDKKAIFDIADWIDSLE
ncbi:MAG: DUF3887 domain-containing protein [Planctomycetes bacterium]|nr:DUF3887 domain-containing protein [Planctomycetota bacterium]